MVALRTGAANSPALIIPSTVVTSFYRDAITKAINGCKPLGFTGPAVLQCAMFNVNGYRFGIGQTLNTWGPQLADADRKSMVLPDVWIDALEGIATAEHIDALARPMMDVLWQAFGVERCMEFDLSGKWAPRP